MNNKIVKTKGMKRILNAFLYSCDGLKHAVLNETAFFQELLIFFVLLIALLLLNIPAILKLILLICNTGVLIVELLNAAIESIADKVSPEYDILAKQAKDMGSAAVLLAILCAVSAWCYALFAIL